jgi:hypothetical protein
LKIELTADGLLVRSRRIAVLNLKFPETLDDLSLRRHKKLLNGSNHAVSRHSTNLHYILNPKWFMEQNVARYFIGESSTTTTIRPLFGLIIGLIMARRAPEALGDFAIALYKRAQDELAEAGSFPSPMTGSFSTLETLFAEKIAAILPAFEEDWQRKNKLDYADHEFIKLTKRIKGGASPAVSTTREPVQIELPFNATLRLAQLKSSVRSNGSVIQRPTFVSSNAPRDGAVKARRTGVTKGSGGPDSREYAGSYVDYTGQVRSIPTLHAETIMGIAHSLSRAPNSNPDLFSQEPLSVLDANLDPESIDYLHVAQQGSSRRRQEAHVGGPNIIAESAEFHVRLFRAIGLTVADAKAFSADELKQLVRFAVGLHAVDTEKSAAA